MGLISFTDKGLYCRQGDFYIDPWRPVEHAVITHAHSDHARYGNKKYLAHTDNKHLLPARLGDINLQTVAYNKPITINGVQVTLYPAGHMVGSAQVLVEYKGERWVVSGDYKTEDDGLTVPFEPVPCHTFITESTFALPVYQWKPQQEIVAEINDWITSNRTKGRNSILTAYSLGKAQRLIHMLAPYGYKFFVHGAINNMQQAINQFMKMPEVTYLTADIPKDEVKGGVIIIPPSAANSTWINRWKPYSLGVCSGWMQVRGAQRRRNADAGFVLSDHADWPGLLQAVKATGAEKVFATHGFSAVLARYLREEEGIDADIVQTQFGEEEDA